MKKILKFLKNIFTKKTIVKSTPSGGGSKSKYVIDPNDSTKDKNIK
jgi:hypothetical protein